MTEPSQSKPDPRLVEQGRKGGIRSGEVRRKRKNRTFLDVLKDRVSSNPEELVDALMGSAPGAVTAARVLEKVGALAPEPEPDPKPAVPPGGASLAAVFELVYRNGLAARYGLPTTHAELDALLTSAGAGEGVPETVGVPPSSSTENPYLPLSGQDPLVPDSPAGRPQRPQETNQPVYDAQAREIAEYHRQREELGLEPNDGNNDRPSRGPRFVELEWMEI